MSAAKRIQNMIYAQRGKAALMRGDDYVLHRPTSAINAIPSEIGGLKATFNAEQSNFEKPNKYGNAVWWGIFDGRKTCVGDYLINDTNTYFIASMQPNLEIQCIECNYTISVESPNLSSRTNVKTNLILSGWPCSILEKGTSKGSHFDYPASMGQGAYIAYLPYFPGAEILTDYTIIDNDGNRYTVKLAEKTTPDMGWRLLVQKILK
jgi:hypothetical protein